MEMKAELEDNPNLFLELVAWRLLGFNASKIQPRLQRDTQRHFLINIHLHGMLEQEASNAITTLIVQSTTRVILFLRAHS